MKNSVFAQLTSGISFNRQDFKKLKNDKGEIKQRKQTNKHKFCDSDSDYEEEKEEQIVKVMSLLKKRKCSY